MDWQAEFQKKLTTAEQAVRLVQSGNRIVIPPFGGNRLAQALAERRTELKDVRITYCAPTYDPGWLQPGWRDCFEVEVEIFIGDFGRRATDERVASYLPNLWSTAYKGQDEGREDSQPFDFLFLTVSPPDKNGNCCIGPYAFNKKSYTGRVRKILAEVDSTVTRVHGDCYVHVSEVEAFVESTPKPVTAEEVQEWLAPIEPERRSQMEELIGQGNIQRLRPLGPRLAMVQPEDLRRFLFLAPPTPDWVKTVAGYVEELIPDGATLQLGGGDPVNHLPRLGVFDNKLDLGLHTEMIVPGVGKLVDGGVINGKRKSMHRGKAVAVFWVGGDDDDLRIIENNPRFELHSSEYVASFFTIMQQEKMVAINNALSIDLTGQINAESIYGGRMINGNGGQPEFHIGAFLAPGGMALTLMASTALNGALSRIVAQHEPGSLITVPRFYADVVVSEYGVARLAGKNHRQRASELVAIAHPDHREELRKAAQELF